MSYTQVFGVMIAVQALNGLTFALMWSSVMEHIHKIAPKELIVTVMMMNSMVHFGICGLITNMLGGIIFQRYGGRMLFRCVALMCALWFVVMVMYSVLRYFKRQQTRQDFPPQVEPGNVISVHTNPSVVESEEITQSCQYTASVSADVEEGCDNVGVELHEPI